jgi:hypothetical protein
MRNAVAFACQTERRKFCPAGGTYCWLSKSAKSPCPRARQAAGWEMYTIVYTSLGHSSSGHFVSPFGVAGHGRRPRDGLWSAVIHRCFLSGPRLRQGDSCTNAGRRISGRRFPRYQSGTVTVFLQAKARSNTAILDKRTVSDMRHSSVGDNSAAFAPNGCQPGPSVFVWRILVDSGVRRRKRYAVRPDGRISVRPSHCVVYAVPFCLTK